MYTADNGQYAHSNNLNNYLAHNIRLDVKYSTAEGSGVNNGPVLSQTISGGEERATCLKIRGERPHP